MSGTKRRNRIIEILKYETDAITAQELADILSVSKRTVHSDLKLLIDEGFSITTVPGTGIIYDELSNQPNVAIDQNTTFSRRIDILRKLLFGEEVVNYIALSEEFYVSTSSIQLDIQFIKEEFLEQEMLELQSDEVGTRLVGDEDAWQATMIHFNEYMQGYHNLQYYDDLTKDFLYQYYGRELVDTSYLIVDSFPKFNLVSVAQYYSLNIINLLSVLAYRANEGIHHSKREKNSYIADEVMMLQHYLIAKDMLDIFYNHTGVGFSDEDAHYLSSYLYGNRIHFAASRVHLGNEYEELIKGFIHQMGECVSVNLDNDNELRNQLMLHVIPMIYRLKNGIYIKNPLLEEIKSEFRMMFDLTWLVSDSLKPLIDENITEDEIGFLMLHFQNALEKAKKSKRIVVVCPNGVTTSALIANKIRRMLPPLDILEIASIDELNHYGMNNIDFIVSTIPLKDIKVPTIVISPILNENDIRKIERMYKEHLINNQKSKVFSNKGFKKYIEPELIFANQEASSKDEVISTVCKTLVEMNIVSEKYEQSIYDREDKGGTDIASGGAVPHGSLDEVNDTKVVVWTNKKSFKWTKYQVKAIVFFVIKKEDVKQIREILEDVFHLIETREDVETLTSVQGDKQLYHYLIGG